MTWHLAQLNIGRLRVPVDDPATADFMANLDPINALAEATPGFVWRLQTEEGNATAIRAFPRDDLMIINMSVWESIETLADFVYRSAHTPFLRRRSGWFEPVTCSYVIDGHAGVGESRAPPRRPRCIAAPPGTGVMRAARSTASSKATSPTLPGLYPASTTTDPGLSQWPRMNSGFPTA